MSATMEDTRSVAADGAGVTAVTPASSTTVDSTDRPIPLWPEGVLVVASALTLVVIGLRHRAYLQRKVTETQRCLEEFQRQGGLDDLQQVVNQASTFLKGTP
jgi:hypothetical protein